jgi:coproporphyrinogen III oxidase-like Fe-S oxidoreductase
MRHCAPLLSDSMPRIMYWGGGTATILTIPEIVALAGTLRETFDLSDLSEATIEGSPETLSLEKLACFYEQGFRRISIGVQSFDDDRLREIGRAHDADTAARSIELARAAGFVDINVDLICGLPGETPRERERSLARALAVAANHYSVYPYRAANGTTTAKLLRHKDRYVLTLENQLEAYEYARATLAAAGYREYSFTFFGSPVCRSDMAYFRLQMDWFGFGAGATSLFQRRYLSSDRANLASFIAEPSRVSEDLPACSPGIVSRLAYQSLTTPEGMEAELWRDRIAVELHDVLAQPAVSYLLDFFRRACPVTIDDRGVRLERDEIARAFIHLQFLNAPARAQRRDGARRLLGAY